MLLYNYLYYFPILVYYDDVEYLNDSPDYTENSLNTSSSMQNSTLSCESTDGYYQVLSWMDLFNSTLLPFCSMLVSTAFIINNLTKSRNRIRSIPTSKSVYPETMFKIRNSSIDGRLKNTSMTLEVTLSTNEDSLRRSSQKLVYFKKREQRDFTFALTSILINVVFIVMNIGIVVFCLLSSYVDMDASTYMFYNSITLNIFFMDYMVKFFLYYAVNSKFRSEFKSLFKQVNFKKAFKFF